MRVYYCIVVFSVSVFMLVAWPAMAEEANQQAIIKTIPPGMGIKSMAKAIYQEAEERAVFVEQRLTKATLGSDPAWCVELLLFHLGESVAQLRNTKEWDRGVALYTKIHAKLASKLPTNIGETDEAKSRAYKSARKKLLQVRQWTLKNQFGSFESNLKKVEKKLDEHEKSLAPKKSTRAEALRQDVARLRTAYAKIAKTFYKKIVQMKKNKTFIKLEKKRDALKIKAKEAARKAKVRRAGQGCYVSQPNASHKAACKVHKDQKKIEKEFRKFEKKFLGLK